jgi:hypothetical protein
MKSTTTTATSTLGVITQGAPKLSRNTTSGRLGKDMAGSGEECALDEPGSDV